MNFTGEDARRLRSAKKQIMQVIGEIQTNEKLTKFGHKAEVHDLARKLARAVLQLEPLIEKAHP
tara:strand:+ start:1922 stop:2113 length:192 start_codon:yes stop_codon:yes gene_type:complete